MLFLEKVSHLFCWLMGKTFFRFFLQFEVMGRENLEGLEKPLIVAFNHSHLLDGFFVNASFPPTSKILPIHFATWKGHYFKPWYRPFLAMAGAFPVEKGIGLEKTLKRGLEILKNGGTVGIAPEGKRRHLGRPRKGRRGVAFLALKTNSPILPVFIEGAIGLRFSHLLSRKKKIKVKIGKPFYLPQPENQNFDLKNLSQLVMEKIYQLRNVR